MSEEAHNSNKFHVIDQKGFVFLDDNGNPFLIRIWEDAGPWLFFWHTEQHWVSFRPVNQTEIWQFYPRRLSDEAAQIYHEKNSQFLNRFKIR